MSYSGRAMARDPRGTLLHAALGTVVFVLLVPVSVVVLGPWLLTGWHVAPPPLGWRVTRWLGAVLLVLALPLFCGVQPALRRRGPRGHPRPIAPTEHLVVSGPFRWVRNPGYVSVIAHSLRLSR
jgi:protein-S-isoprenylcysteine O-methyltransferase Ste14